MLFGIGAHFLHHPVDARTASNRECNIMVGFGFHAFECLVYVRATQRATGCTQLTQHRPVVSMLILR